MGKGVSPRAHSAPELDLASKRIDGSRRKWEIISDGNSGCQHALDEDDVHSIHKFLNPLRFASS